MRNPLQELRDFLRLESASGIVLLGAAMLALLAANSPSRAYYDGLLATQFSISLGTVGIRESLLGWINDGLMAVFFLLVSLEIKRELLHGHLASFGHALLPAVAALGGVVAPALIYWHFNAGSAESLRGWAIPSATDIAFSLGVLALLGSRVPLALKIFLTTLAVIDDLAAILIIALFYTAQIHTDALIVAGGVLAALIVLNRCGVRALWPYLALGLVLWVAVLESGVHATIGGVLLGLCIPAKQPPELGAQSWGSPLERLEDRLHPWVAFGIMPVFAFANAGLALQGIALNNLADSVPLGIALGLLLGKPLGIMAAAGLCIRLGFAKMPEETNWPMLAATAVIAGIGFTMSLFIAGLAFPGNVLLQDEARLGILLGSALSALLGYAMFRVIKR